MKGRPKKTETKYIGKKFGSLTIIKYIENIPLKNQTKGKRMTQTIIKVKCDCGVIKNILLDRIREGARSCGCRANNRCGIPNEMKSDLGIGAANNVYSYYKTNAKKRGYEFTLTKEEFIEMSKLDCYYCNKPPSNLKSSKNKYGEDFKYNGLDRIDNNKGYINTNIVPCCKYCNITKMDLSIEEFKNHITNIYFNFIQ